MSARPLTAAHLFDGIGGFHLATDRVGMETLWVSEIDKHASTVLKHHWPQVPNYGDIHDLTGPPAVDVLTGGFPCQDYSVAGKGAGLAGDRGALWWQFHRVIAECRPTWVVAENVDGLTTKKHRESFQTIIGSLVDLGYGVVWRVLDARWFGVAQRRRRVFIIGHSGGQPRPEILALAQGVSGDTPPSREAGERSAPTLAARTRGGGGLGTDTELDGGLISFNWQTGGDGMLSPRSTHTDALVAGQTPALAFQLRGRDGSPAAEVDPDGLVGTLRGADGGSSRGRMVAYNPFRSKTGPGEWVEGFKPDDVHDALTAMQPPKGSPLVTAPIVRRLTPLECERLQGFPDHWTNIPGNSDSQRYKQLGNAVAVPVAEWIMKRIHLRVRVGAEGQA